MGLAAEGGCVLPVPLGTQTAGGSWDESGSRGEAAAALSSAEPGRENRFNELSAQMAASPRKVELLRFQGKDSEKQTLL